MELNGSRTIAATRQTVWDALNDPDVLRACIPGCEELTGTPAEGFEAKVVQKIGPVKATFRGAVKLENVVEAQSYTISGEGKGGAAGFAKGGADVTLADVEGGTELTYAVDAKVGGKLAQLGSRLIDGTARKLADQFFENFQKTVEGDTAPVVADAPAEAGEEAGTFESVGAAIDSGVSEAKTVASDALERVEEIGGKVREEAAELVEDAGEVLDDAKKEGKSLWKRIFG